MTIFAVEVGQSPAFQHVFTELSLAVVLDHADKR
jgi:hypothetical protein